MQALDQHSRGRVPGYTGHRPQHNVCLEPPPPSALTTWGAASQQALRRCGWCGVVRGVVRGGAEGVRVVRVVRRGAGWCGVARGGA